jgi:hypothetical protein
MGNRFSRSWDLVKQSYNVLKTTPNLAFFPLISGIACLIASASFLVPIGAAEYATHKVPALGPLQYVVLFLLYFLTSFIVIFFNAGLVSCAYDALNGRPTNYVDGLRNAGRHFGQILAWSAISATVGTILRAISERVPYVGRIVIALLGAAWQLITYFVIPVMIVENNAPVPAVKRSFGLIKSTWGERCIGGGAIGLVIGLLYALVAIPIIIGIFAAASGFWPVLIVACVVSIVYCLALAVVGSTLAGIFNTAVYIFASTGTVPAGFNEEYIRMAFVQKQQSRMFGRTF